MKLKSIYTKLPSTQRLYSLECPIISITGGISTGKSTVSKILIDFGHPVIDADQLVKDIYALPETIQLLSEECVEVLKNRQIDFKLLREKFFSSPELKNKLENWIYPRLEKAFKNRFKLLGEPSYVFYEVPLLFERKLSSYFDLNVLVYTNSESQISRVMERDGISKETARRILEAQLDIDKKLSMADVIIRNEGNLQKLKEEVSNFLQKYFE